AVDRVEAGEVVEDSLKPHLELFGSELLTDWLDGCEETLVVLDASVGVVDVLSNRCALPVALRPTSQFLGGHVGLLRLLHCRCHVCKHLVDGSAIAQPREGVHRAHTSGLALFRVSDYCS